MDEVAVNFGVHGGRNYLIMVDRASGYVFCKETKQQTTADTIKVLDGWFYAHGKPRTLRADDGPLFRKGFCEYLEKKGIQRQTSAAYNSQSNGLVERAVQKCKAILKHCAMYKEDWKQAMAEMQTMPSRQLNGACPAEVFLRRMPRGMLPTL